MALTHATDLAETYDATLHILFAVQDDFGSSGMVEKEHEGVEHIGMVGGEELLREREEAGKTGMTSSLPETREAIREEGRMLVEAVADSVSGVRVETAVVSGEPYKRIREYADEQDVDLIVMGTHGRTGVDRYLLGSVTEKVVRTVDQPVLTVRMNDESGAET